MITTSVGAGLLLLFVVLMSLRERRTEVIILTATDYSLPAPLNPWAVEDAKALKELEQENLTPVTDISDKWNQQPSLATLLQLLDEQIEETKEPLIVYLNMHGVVNDEQIPCLLPPGVGLGETTKLMPVRRILEHISQLAANRRDALVILDCNRIRANWHLGIVYNTFTERLQEVLKSNPVSNVAVLCSAGPGQVNWASADLQGSSFGRYLQLGLAGAADSGESADGDGAVTLPELVAYLQREVSAWSQFNRGEPQQPALISGEAGDFHVAYNVRDSETLKGLVSKFYGQKRAEPEKRADIAALWAQFEKLRTPDFVRQDPVGCRDFEFDLLRLEALSQGGSAYRQSAEDELNLLKDKLAQAVAQKEATANSRSVSDHLGLGTIRVAAHTLPMAEYFGECDAQLSERIGQLWSAPVKVADNNAQSAAGERELEIARDLAEMQLLLAAREQGVVSLWQSHEPLTGALKLRDRAEALAVPRGPKGQPGDERAHYFARPALNAADEKRRFVEDVLFIGPRSGQDFAALTAEAAEHYQSAAKVMQEATAAYAIRDAALAEAPYLGWWLCGPASLEVPDRNALINELIEFIRQSRALNQAITSPQQLTEGDPSPGNSGLPFQHVASTALKHQQALKDAFQRKNEDLLGAGSQGITGWTALDSALTTPLIPATQRRELLAKRDDVSEQLFSRYSELKRGEDDARTGDDPREKESSAGDNSAASYLEGIQSWESHPLVEILLEENSQAARNDLDWCDEVAKRLRSRLARLPSSEDDGAGTTESAGDDILRDRQQLSRSESELRASAALGFGLGGIKADPIIALREFDIRQLLVWHGERVMGDFWGDASGVDEPFFVRAASHYLDAARSLGTPTPAFGDHVGERQKRLTELDKAKRKQLELKATPQLVNELQGEVAVQLQVAANSATYPPGRGSVYLRDQSRQRFDIQFEDVSGAGGNFLAYPPKGAPQDFLMTILRAPSDAARAEAVSFFRGQEDTDPFEMPTFKGVRIEYEPYVYDRQSITLFGDRPEQLSLVLILDCSSSMKELSRIAERGAQRSVRMELARNNFKAMLNDIVERNREGEATRVGVRFYGHRLGWNIDGSQLLKQDAYKGTIPDNLTPSEDVEPVLTLGRFNDNIANDVYQLLDSVKPWGETPLYLALLQALDDFNEDNKQTRKSIIAITDGRDYQSLHNSRGLPAPGQTTLTMLLDEYKRRKLNIPIHILGFDIKEKEEEAAQKEFKQIEAVTGGSYKEVKSGQDLLNNLRVHLNVADYTVRPVSAPNRNALEQVKLRTRVEISNAQPLPDDFLVEFLRVKKEVSLKGGEAIELYAEKNGAFVDIVAHEYNKRTPLLKANLINGTGGSETDLILRAHRPVREQGTESIVRFPISLQRETRASHFTPRPAETWLEITPLSDNGSGQTDEQQPYVFYDTNFEPDEPVPVLVCPALDWHDWPKARINFWCKYRVTAPILEIGLRNANYRTPQNVPDINGIQLRVETFESGGVYRVYVAENHSAQSPGVDNALRIQFETDPQYKPIRVRHQFDKEKGLATHSFEFRSTDREAIESFDGSRIVVTRAADIKDGALQLAADSPLEISVQLPGGYHTTGAESNGQ